MSPLNVPSATVIRLQYISTKTRANPAKINNRIRAMKLLEHCLHLEFPKTTLKPSLHFPQIIPERLN